MMSREWSLITGRGGGATKREGGHVKFIPARGAEKVLAMLKGGGQNKFLGSFSTETGEVQKVSTHLKGGARKD